MPYYYKLRIRDNDSDADKAAKRRVAGKLLELRKAIAAHIGSSTHGATDDDEDEHGDDAEHGEHSDDSTRLLRLATWNIREFDSGKFGKRLDESFYYIAEILSNFDLIAVQEVREDITALTKVMRILGSGWDYIATDVTEGSGGNRERMVFVYNKSKVWFRNIAGELTLSGASRITYPHEERLSFDKSLELQLPAGKSLASPAEVETRKRGGKHYLTKEAVIDLPNGTRVQLPAGSQVVLPEGYEVSLTDGKIDLPGGTDVSLKEKGKNKEVMVKLPKGAIVGDSLQFARTPSMVAFQCGWLKINLCTVHIYYGSDKTGLKRRKDEIRHLTEFLAKRAASDSDSDSDSFFIALGDFNIVDQSHETMKALKTNGFEVPKALQSLPGSNVDQSKAYDQIAYWTDPDGKGFASKSVTKIEVHRAGVFDFFETVFREGADDPNKEDETHYTGLKEFQPGWKYKDWRTFQMSDHLPMWIELRIDFGDEYLEQIRDSQE